MEAQPHPRQADRLRALRSYEVLDTDREKDFDDIVQLASAICGTAISVVNLIDEDRQWFKAEVGLGVRETPLATSLCSHAILEEDFLEVNDTLEDARMADNPLCAGEQGLRFYAGALLKTDEGLPLGTLCVLDYRPRELTPLQRDTLRVLARQVMAQLEMRKALAAARVLRQEVDHRVKNSLQSLSALARVQARFSQSEETREALDQMRVRIEAVATLHEQLYKTEAHSVVDLGQYLGHLAEHLRQFAPTGVTLQLEADPVEVTVQQAVSAGTLVNEFVTNAFKHAFPGGSGGRVLLEARTTPDGQVRVRCTDDGVGMQVEALSQPGKLGMKIAELVCKELNCELVLRPVESGTRVDFSFLPEAA
jgi:two-component sensor histidine kinase